MVYKADVIKRHHVASNQKNYAEIRILKGRKHKFTRKNAEMIFWIFEKCPLAPLRDLESKYMSIFEFPTGQNLNNKK